jgi:hypothetical protein
MGYQVTAFHVKKAPLLAQLAQTVPAIRCLRQHHSSCHICRYCCCAAPQHNTLPVIFKPEMPSRIGLLPLTARSGDEVRMLFVFSLIAV